MQAGAILLALALGTAQPATTDNNASCEIAVTPAATLLLPYFEVDTLEPAGANTLFTVTNTGPVPQIAHVTLWTDWAFPVLNFNLYLTGYDVQGINLRDVIVDGKVPSTTMTDDSNPNFLHPGIFDVNISCSNLLPGALPAELMTAVRNALTVGVGYAAGGAKCGGPVGGNHPGRAVGYATIDVVSYCSTQFPTDAGGAYFLGPRASLLFDNVLVGDYQQLAMPLPYYYGYPAIQSDAQGSPMVHIRAVPEGGLSGVSGGMPVQVNLPYTFYDRYTPAAARTADRRQPLPSQFGVHYIQGGTGEFATDFKIWREGATAGLPTCAANGTVQSNSVIILTSLVRFDEHGNSWTSYSQCFTLCAPFLPSLPAASRVSSSDSPMPPFGSTDIAGWMVFNLSSGAQVATTSGSVCSTTLSAQREGFGGPCATAAPGKSGSRATTQNWVIASLSGRLGTRRLTVDYDAAALGNGCTPQETSPAYAPAVAPATQRKGVLVCPAGAKCGSPTQPPIVNP